jgi:hypothetical protein
MCTLGKTLLSIATTSENDKVSEFLKQELTRRSQSSIRGQLAARSDQSTSLDHAQKFPSPGLVSSGSMETLQRNNNWRLEEQKSSGSLSELRDTEEPHISAITVRSNLGVPKPVRLTSTEPTICELNRIDSTRTADIYAQAQYTV